MNGDADRFPSHGGHRLLFCFGIVMVLLLFATVSFAGSDKVALVIGNGDYAQAPLQNPVNDAEDMSRALKGLGFDVITRKNATKREMLDALYAFADKLKKAEIGFFFYAGHGMQIKGANYLIPVGTSVRSAVDVEDEGLNANRVLGKMEEAGNRLNVVILDACRNNPFRSMFRSTSQGLAKMDAPVGSIIAYATSPGSVALDGSGRNGVFTKHLLGALKKKDLTVRQMFDVAGLGVMRETDRKQVPWLHSSPMEPIYLAGGNPDEVYSDAGSGYREEPKTGTIKVTSTPSGARVEIDGGFAGTTPLTVGNLAPGTVRASVSRDGYASAAREATIHAGRRAVINFSLEQEQRAKTGWLTVNPTPAGAKVRILNIGPTYYTPGMELAAGRYHLEVSAQGYETEKRWVELAASDDLQVSVRLEEVGQVSVQKEVARTFTDPVTGMEFVWVPAGCFMMGNTFGDGESYEKPVHEVCVDGFYMGEYEVTRGEYRKITGSSPAKFKNGDRHPVEQVSWHDAQDFIKKLNARSGKSFRLPTEAEWEYAARSGGKEEKFSGGGNVEGVAWYGSNSGGATHQVGLKTANGLGLHDMSGNVWEWCQDWYGEDYYSSSPRHNPTGPSSGSYRVGRGGGWSYGPSRVRTAYRSGVRPWGRSSSMGFRLVLPLQGQR